MRLIATILRSACAWTTTIIAAPVLDHRDRYEQIIQASVARHDFMGSVLIAHDGVVVLNKGYGFANLEWNIPNSPDTKFRLGSLTKQFTAASILLLEERGKLNVDDPVRKYMPDSPPAWDKITIAHLLTHTSGIPNSELSDDQHTAILEPSGDGL